MGKEWYYEFENFQIMKPIDNHHHKQWYYEFENFQITSLP